MEVEELFGITYKFGALPPRYRLGHRAKALFHTALLLEHRNIMEVYDRTCGVYSLDGVIATRQVQRPNPIARIGQVVRERRRQTALQASIRT